MTVSTAVGAAQITLIGAALRLFRSVHWRPIRRLTAAQIMVHCVVVDWQSSLQ
jgi:hypothetical protein